MALPVTAATRLSDHRNAHVDLTCRHLGHSRDVRAEALARVIGWETVLSTRID